MSLQTLTDKTAGYKSRLQKADFNKKSQLKIMKKTYETQLQMKNDLINNLQDMIEEQEEKLSEIESSKENNDSGVSPIIFKPSGIQKLVKSINDLFMEKNTIHETWLSTQSELEAVKQEHQDSIKRLKSEISDLDEKHKALQTEYHNIQNGDLVCL